MVAKKKPRPMKIDPVLARAVRLRDRCLDVMMQCVRDPETYGDPGDAVLTIEGNDKNALNVLYILDAIGVPACKP